MPATTEVTELIQNLVRGILRDPAEAEAYSENPSEYLAAHGVADHDLTEVDMRPIVVEAAKECDLPEPSKALIDNYANGQPAPQPAAVPAPAPAPAPPGPGPRAEEPVAPAPAPPPPAQAIEPPPVEPPDGMSPLQSIEQHISYVTYVSHESNTNVVQNLIDNSTVIDNSSNVSFEVGGDVYGDIDMTNDVTNVNATGDGAVAAGDAIVDSNVNTGSGNITDVGTINANESAVAVGGDATNIQDRSIDNSVTDNSVDTTNVNIQDSFNTDNSVDSSINVDIDDSFNDNSSIDNSVDSSIDVDVALGGGRSVDPAPSAERPVDPGFGQGETRTDDPSVADMVDGMPGTRDGTQEQYDEKYSESNLSGTPQPEPGSDGRFHEDPPPSVDAAPTYEEAPPMVEEAAPIVADRPIEAMEPMNEAPLDDMGGMD